MPGSEQLARNLVEYVGMVYRGGEDCSDVANWLLDLIRSEDLHGDVRYNAARALERCHPYAPKPYFDYMSDWGDQDWEYLRRQTNKNAIRPYAIHAFRVRKGRVAPRRPGNWPPIQICPNGLKDASLQKHVSLELGKIILSLLDEPKENDWLLINCTFAWVRWYDEAQRRELEEARERAKGKGASNEVVENLKTWVGDVRMKYP